MAGPICTSRLQEEYQPWQGDRLMLSVVVAAGVVARVEIILAPDVNFGMKLINFRQLTSLRPLHRANDVKQNEGEKNVLCEFSDGFNL